MKKIEINGTEISVYESLFEYVDDADITDYVLHPGINAVKPIDDPYFYRPSIDDLSEEIANYFLENDLEYVNWGEEEISAIPRSEINYTFYVFGRGDGSWDSSYGWIATLADAEAAGKIYTHIQIDDLLKDLQDHGVPEDRIQKLMEDEGRSVFICGTCGRVVDVDFDSLDDGRIYFSCPNKDDVEEHTEFSLEI